MFRVARVLLGPQTEVPPERYPMHEPWTHPAQLAEFGNVCLPGLLRCEQRTYSDAATYVEGVRASLNNGHVPVVLWCLGSMFRMHYVVVVGHDNGGFLILDWMNGAEPCAFRATCDEFERLSFNPIPLMDGYRVLDCRRAV